MWGRVARYELSRQLGNRVFLVVATVSFLMVLGSIGVDALRVDVPGGGLRNGAEAIVRTHLVWTLFYLFTCAAFVGEAALRDEAAGIAPVVRASPVRARDLAVGRFLGAWGAASLCFLTVPAAFLLAPSMPWVAPETLGPTRPEALAFGTLVIAAPNLFLASAFFLVLAAATRAMGAVLLGAVALITVYGLGSRSGAALAVWAEPFGFAAYGAAIANWPVGLRDSTLPWGDPGLLTNRALVLLAGAAALALGARLYRAETTRTTRARLDGAPAPSATRYRPVSTRTGPGAIRARLGLEVAQAVRTPVFVGLLGMALVGGFVALRAVPDGASDPAFQRALHDAFALAPLIVILFFAGELLWNERERRIDGLIGATPLARGAFVLPKLGALLLILAGLAATTLVAAGLAGGWLRLPAAATWAASAWYEWALLAALAMALQLIAPGKLAGWGLFVLFLIASLTLERLGLTDPLYRYARHPGWPLPGGPEALTYRLGWGALAVLLMAGALRLSKNKRSAAG